MSNSKKAEKDTQNELFDVGEPDFKAIRLERLKLYKQKKAEGKPTYFTTGSSIKCLLCKETNTSQVHVDEKYCISCDLFHENPDK